MEAYLYKTPEKASKNQRREFSSFEKLSTAQSLSKTFVSPLKQYSSQKSSPFYNTEIRQYYNVYPDIYVDSRKYYIERREKKELLSDKYAFSIDELNRQLIENENEFEEIKEKLAYTPDFSIEILFSIISKGKNFITFSDLQKFYYEIFYCHITQSEFNRIEKNGEISYQSFRSIFLPKKEIYNKFYRNKKCIIIDDNLNFFNYFVKGTQELIMKMMMELIKKERKDEEIRKNIGIFESHLGN